MAYKISGNLGEDGRIIIVDETDWSIETNQELSAGAYEITNLSNTAKSVVARTASGKVVAYGNVTPFYYSGQITVPYTYSFEDLENGSYEGDGINWYTINTPPTYNDSITSYDSSWTGGLVFNTTDGSGFGSKFWFDGDFDVSIRYSTDSTPLLANAYSIYMRVYDYPSFNNAGPMFGTSGGTHLIRTQSKTDGGVWEVNSSKATDNFEPEFRIVRSGNVISMYDGTTLLSNKTISTLPKHLYLLSRAYDTIGTNNEDFYMNRIKIDSGTIKYPLRDAFEGTNGDPVDSEIWTESTTATVATVIDNNRAKQELVDSESPEGRGYIYYAPDTPISGDFTVWIDMSLASAPSTSRWTVLMSLFFENVDDFVYVQRAYSSSHRIALSYYDGNDYLHALDNSSINSGDTDFNFCFTRVGTTVTGYYKFDGTWYRAVYPNSYSAAVERIGLTCYTRDSYPDITVYWDNFGLIY
jgi:hypothetical protein